MRKIILPKKSIKRIYIVIYDQQEFFGNVSNLPIKAFKTKKDAELYAHSRNFEFQSICLLDEEDYENYVLNNQYSDFIVSISDFREAGGYIREELIRYERSQLQISVWTLLEDIKPFKVMPIEYLGDNKSI